MNDNTLNDAKNVHVQDDAQDGVFDDLDTAEDALAAIGISLEDAIDGDNALLRSSGNKSKLVCVCGHPVSRHTETVGVVYCKPTRMECPCKKIRPVLEAEDLRCFLRKTAGSGSMHALTRGMAASAQKEKKVRWVIDLKCDRCKKHVDRLVPTPVTQSGIAVNYPTGHDALLCHSCLGQV